jgi:probable F420-dependent oxidoreductase
MKFGVTILAADFSMRPDELAVAVEERGFESLFFQEHTNIPALGETGLLPAQFSHTFDLFVTLSYAAEATTRLRVGSGINLVPEHHPINAAKALASIDVLSEGRLLWGVGTGWIDGELANLGVDPKRRWSVTAEYLRAIRTIWREDRAEFHGRYVDFDPMWSRPKPLRPEGPPLLLGGNGPRILERVVEFGDEWFPEDYQTPEELGVRIKQLQEAAERAGRGPIPVSIFGPKPKLAYWKRLAEAGVHRIVSYIPSADRDTVLGALDELTMLRHALLGAIRAEELA